jgi:sigma-B regulation protein RsbU (phosphoserine phosphatase)
MEAKVFEQFRYNLVEKRQTLTDWLSTASARKKQARLGPADEGAVRAHLDVIDTAIEKSATETLGLCTVCHDYVDAEFLEIDYTCCVCIDHLSEEEKRSLENELELSQTVQKGLLPQQVPDIPGLELAVFSRPAQIVSGDYFDFFLFGDGAHGLTIADVAGKGVSASLVMASVQTALRALAPTSRSPGEVLRRMNHLFCHNIQFTTFVTVFLGSFDQRAHTLTYGNAGHNPPLVFRNGAGAGDPVAWLRPTGAAIGLVEEAQFGVERTGLFPGDTLLLYTDGVTEATNRQNEEFGEERLAELVRRESGSSAKALVRSLRGALEAFSDGRPLSDDTTIIACKVAES